MLTYECPCIVVKTIVCSISKQMYIEHKIREWYCIVQKIKHLVSFAKVSLFNILKVGSYLCRGVKCHVTEKNINKEE